ncbi:splicing factor 3b, partial [Jimgerdemannia flammicorona]
MAAEDPTDQDHQVVNGHPTSDLPTSADPKKNNDAKLKKRRKKKKVASKQPDNESATDTDADLANDVEIEYVTQAPELDFFASAMDTTEGEAPANTATLKEFEKIFKHFQIAPPENGEETKPSDSAKKTEAAKPEDAVAAAKKALDSDSDANSDSDDGKKKEPGMSKKKLRKQNRLSVAELKQLVKKPEVVEWVDVTAADPKLLVSLKAYRNTVPVPKHWAQKRKYLQGKRGIEKPPWDLPAIPESPTPRTEFIKDTGIMQMREAVKEKEDAAKLKTKTRERLQPKMGKLDIDYQKLHDAFFRYQTRPRLTIHGELYYEGKEFETKLKEKKPGSFSDDLKGALGMPPLAPPPWLINMQYHGPPPSYPNLKIPGLNAPIPEGAQWGYHPGGWGRPPVDEV